VTQAASTPLAADAGKSDFLLRTYLHLFGAIGLFALIEVVLFSTGAAEGIARGLLSVNWLVVLGGFVLVSWFASLAAHTVRSQLAQYAALGVYVLGEALIFVPLLYAAGIVDPGAIRTAAVLTLTGFGLLTLVVHQTGRDFSFLRTFLVWGGLIALLLIVVSVLFAAPLGPLFTIAMIGYAGAAILFDTSNVLRDFPEDRYIAAALELFASIALMFWYVLQYVLESTDP
jgi:FtsH-binding integral membrane protein